MVANAAILILYLQLLLVYILAPQA